MYIAIIDDEKLLNRNISKKLELNGYKVSSFYSYNDFVNSDIDLKYFDLFLVDLGLGDGNGFDIIKKIRNKSKLGTPIIIISGYNDKQNIVYGLDIGADDYLKKPILPEELVARVRAILRRPKKIVTRKEILSYRDVTYDPNSREVRKGKNIVELSKRETDIVELFMKNQGKLIPKNDFIILGWGEEKLLSVSDNTIYVTLSTIRKKLGAKFKLESKKNLGYILA